ncbi:MAG: mechanosensitive ion channel [Deltaproteobacteria bacterium]|nr:mechanosensitive ion channel [Deltaproteobacteria bacterium]
MEALLTSISELLQTPFVRWGSITIPVYVPLRLILAVGLAFWVGARLEAWLLARLVKESAGETEADHNEDRRTAARLVRWPFVFIAAVAALADTGLNLDGLRVLGGLELLHLGSLKVTLSSALLFSAALAFAWWGSQLAERGFKRAFALRGVQDDGGITVTGRLVHHATMALGIGVALELLGFDLSALFAAGAIFAVGLGFAMQNIVENFVSGIILLMERSIKPSDVLHLNGEDVMVKQLGVRSTVVLTRDDEDVIVPNAIIVQAMVKNYNYADSIVRVRAPIGVSYGSDMALVERVLQEVGDASPHRHSSRAAVVMLRSFGASSVDWELSIWIDRPWTRPTALSDLNKALWFALLANKIEIPFPQLDLHVDDALLDRLRSRRDEAPQASQGVSSGAEAEDGHAPQQHRP